MNAMTQVLLQAHAKPAARAKAAKPKAKAKKAKVTIASITIKELKAGRKPAKVLAIIKKKFADCKTTMACVYWYASRINRGMC